MGYSPGVLLKIGQISTLSNSPEIDTNSRASSQKSFQKGFGGISESLERYHGLAKIRHFQNHGLQPRVFAQNRPNFDPLEFTRNRHKQSHKELEIILEGFWRHFREFGAISRTCPNPPFSKPWAIAQGFCTKSAKFRPSRIHPKSTQTVAQGVRNHFRRVQEAFQRVWSDFQDLPKSAMFKTMGYSPGVLLKICQISNLSNSPEIDTNSCARSQNSFQKGFGSISESLERFPGLSQIRLFQNHGLQPRLFAQNRPNFDPLEFTRNRHKQSRKELEIILEGFWRHFREFGAIPRTCPNPPFSKPSAIAQGFCSKSAKFRPSRIHPKSTQTVTQRVRNHFRRVQEAFQRVWSDFQDLPKSSIFKTMGYSPGFLLKNVRFSTLSNSLEIDTNSRAKSQKSFQTGLGGISESLDRFPGLAQIRRFQNHGLQPRVFAQKRSIFDPLKFTRNRHKQSRKELEIILEGFWRHFREFGAIPRTCPNPPCSKPWAIAQGFCSKTFDFRPSRIHPKSTQTVAQGVRNHVRRVQEAFQRVWSDSPDLPKSAMFKTMGYSPGFLLKSDQISTLSNSPEIDTNSRAKSQKSFQKGFGGISESLQRFPGLAQIRHFQNHGLQPRGFAQNLPNFDPLEFTRNRHKQSRNELEIILEGFWRHLREFGAIPRTCLNPPCSKPWAIAQGFCSKSAKFRPSRIHPKSTQTVAQVVRNHFRRVLEAFQRVWSDTTDLPKSAIFKTMGYSPGFLLKIGQISTLSNSPEIDTNSHTKSQKSFQKGFGGISESLERFPGLAQIRHFQNRGLQPRVFAQNRPNFDPLEFTRNRHKQSRKELEIILEGFRRHFREFGAISRTCPNPPCSKPWAIAQGFCSKSAKFRTSRIHPKSTQTVAQGARTHFRRVLEAFQRVWSDFQDLPKSAFFKTMGYSPGFLLKIGQTSTLSNSPEIDTNSRARSQKSFQKGFGGISESLERFHGLAQIRHFQNHRLQPRVFAQNRPNFDPLEFTRNRHKQSRKELEIILEGFRRHFREFGAISRTCPNPPFSKPWAIAQGFCSKTFVFRPSRILSKSTQTVAQRVRNHFRRVQEAFQRVWIVFQDLPKSAVFKTMGYSPGFLLKNVRFSTLSNSPEIDTNSRARSQKSFQKGFGGISESLERFPGLAQIRHVQNHGLQPRVFAQNRPNFDPLEFTRNRHKQSRKELEIILEGFRRHFREFGAIPRTCPNPPCSKPWAIAQGFCSKATKFRPSRIHPKSTQTVAQRVRNHFRRVLEAFERVWSDFPDLPKSAIFKTMGYSPGFLLKIGQISTLLNSPEIDTNSRARSQNSFQKGFGGISESLQRFPGLAQIRHFQNHGLQPRVFAQNRPNFDPLEFSRNRHKQSRKELEILLEGFWRHFREFGAISRTCPNTPCSKPWAIAQGFCSKTASFRPPQIHPKSTQTVAQRVRNHFRRVQEAFQRVWSDFQDLPKSAIFKTVGYRPGILLKNGQFSTLSNSRDIDTNCRAKSQKQFQKSLGGI